MWDMQSYYVLDGGTGREIGKRGLPFRQPQWSALVLEEKPEALIDIHSDFIKAGAQIITANTYAIAPFHITEEKFLKEAPRLIQLACEMAIQAKKIFSGKNIKVALSVPPLFGSYRYDLFKENQGKSKEYYQLFLNSVKGLEEEIDLYLCETLSCIEEAHLLCGLMQNIKRPYIISFSADSEKYDLKNGTIQELVELINGLEYKPQAVMINCCTPEIISETLPKLASLLPKQVKFGAYANSLILPKTPQANSKVHEVREDITVENYQAFAAKWAQMGASIIGGCCGIGPEYLPGIVQIFEKQKMKKSD